MLVEFKAEFDSEHVGLAFDVITEPDQNYPYENVDWVRILWLTIDCHHCVHNNAEKLQEVPIVVDSDIGNLNWIGVAD